MNIAGDTLEQVPAGLGMASRCEDLTIIGHPTCSAAVWQRKKKPSFLPWLESLDAAKLPNARVIIQPAQMRDALVQICDISGTPKCQERNDLIDDVIDLAEVFARLMDSPYLRVRFDVVTTNACRKFHHDAVTARLVCTYRGTGTQYGSSNGGADPENIFTVPTGAAMIMRGSLWREAPKSNLLHRSPPIEGTGETRSVLVLDPVFDLEREV